MSVYLDASVILPGLIEEPASALVDRFIEDLPDQPIIGEFAAAEAASALSRLVRTRLLVTLDSRLALAAADLGVAVKLLA